MNDVQLQLLQKYGLNKDSYKKLRKELSELEERQKEAFLNQRSDKFTIVLNDNELNLFKSANNIVSKFCTCDDWCCIYVASIKHDKDIDEETHQLKTVHYHVVIHINKICRIGTMINRIMDLFHCNENQITIDKCNSVCMQSRYLIHLDDYDKADYFESDVATNDVNTFKNYLDLVIIRDLSDLIAFVDRKHYCLTDIMQSIAHYDKWRKYINDLIVNHYREMRV